MDAAGSSEMLIITYQTVGSYIPGNSNFYARECVQKTVIFIHVSLSTFRNTKDYGIRTNFGLCILLFT